VRGEKEKEYLLFTMISKKELGQNSNQPLPKRPVTDEELPRIRYSSPLNQERLKNNGYDNEKKVCFDRKNQYSKLKGKVLILRHSLVGGATDPWVKKKTGGKKGLAHTPEGESNCDWSMKKDKKNNHEREKEGLPLN